MSGSSRPPADKTCAPARDLTRRPLANQHQGRAGVIIGLTKSLLVVATYSSHMQAAVCAEAVETMGKLRRGQARTLAYAPAHMDQSVGKRDAFTPAPRCCRCSERLAQYLREKGR